MAWHDGLRGAARNIAGTDDSPLRVMAGPGTGKTFAMKRRVVRLLEEGVDPNTILVVTFTRTAASDLVDELHSLDLEGCEHIRAGTLHAFCFWLLSKRAVFEYLGRVARPLVSFNKAGVLQFEAAPMLADLTDHRFGGKRDKTKRIRAFEAAWARLQTDDPGWPDDLVDRRFQAALEEWLRLHRAMLIGELVPESLRYLRNNPTTPELHKFEHVIVDEYQDLNKAEQVLIDTLANGPGFVVVGDKDQSIYSFRHAHPEGIEDFSETHEHTHDEVLRECRRCPRRVVAIADSLIRRNYPGRRGERLRPMPGNPEGEISIVQWDSLQEEADGLSAFVNHLIDERHFDPGEILVLSPRRRIGYAIRDELVNRGIPTHSFYHEEMLETDAAQLSFSLLTLLADSDDRVALRFWLGYGSPTWLAGEYGRLRKHCEETGSAPWDALGQLDKGTLKIGGTTRLLRRFQSVKRELHALHPLVGDALIDRLFPEEHAEYQVIREAATAIGDADAGANTLLENLRAAVTQPEMPEEGEFVRIMSLHKSKGLTSRAVVIPGCIMGLIPNIDYGLPEAAQRRSLQEQRRLFYVAITRTTEILVLSSARRMERKLAYRLGARLAGRLGSHGDTLASMFLAELGEEAPDAIASEDWIENRNE